jgi:hypothetical protein
VYELHEHVIEHTYVFMAVTCDDGQASPGGRPKISAPNRFLGPLSVSRARLGNRVDDLGTTFAQVTALFRYFLAFLRSLDYPHGYPTGTRSFEHQVNDVNEAIMTCAICGIRYPKSAFTAIQQSRPRPICRGCLNAK